MTLLALWAREACASVALAHPVDCPCLVCEAARGDVQALAEVLDILERERTHASR